MNQSIDNILKAAAKLPPFPRVAQKVLSLLEDPNVGVKEQVSVVELDPNLVANVLKAVNSAYYALPRKVNNLSEALAFLGNRRFQELVLSSATVKLLSSDQKGYEQAAGDLWRHSLATALMSYILAERIGHKPGPALYTAALLHDIGKVVLSGFVADKTDNLKAAVAAGETFLDAERKVLGINHAELGGGMAAAWKFSPEMVDLISFHHEPDKKPESTDLALLYLANALTQMYGLGGSIDGLAQRADPEVITRLKLKQKDLQIALAELDTRLSKAEALLNMK